MLKKEEWEFTGSFRQFMLIIILCLIGACWHSMSHLVKTDFSHDEISQELLITVAYYGLFIGLCFLIIFIREAIQENQEDELDEY